MSDDLPRRSETAVAWRWPVVIVSGVSLCGIVLSAWLMQHYHLNENLLNIDNQLLRKLNLLQLSLSRYETQQIRLQGQRQGDARAKGVIDLAEAKTLYTQIDALLTRHDDLLQVDELRKLAVNIEAQIGRVEHAPNMPLRDESLVIVNQQIDFLVHTLRVNTTHRSAQTDAAFRKVQWTIFGTVGVAFVGVVWMVRRAVLQRLQKKIRHTEWTAANIKAQTAQLFNAMPSACLIVDSGQRIVKMNQAAHTLLMRENENREGQLFWYKLLPNSAEQPREVLVERFLQRKNLNGVVQGDAFLLNRDGESFMAHWSDIPLRDVGGELIGYFFIIDDISERHNFERSLRKLTQDLLSTQQDERARLAQVLHDDIAQQLSAMRLMVEAAEKRRRNEGGDDAAVFEQVLPLIKESVEDVLNIIRQRLNDLRPPLLNELGLACALEHEVKRLSQSTTAELQLSMW